MAMMVATMPSMRSVDLSFAGLRLPAGSWATATLAFHSVQRHYAICTKAPPSPHYADDHTGAGKRWRLAALLLFGPCHGERTGARSCCSRWSHPAVGALDVGDAELVDMALKELAMPLTCLPMPRPCAGIPGSRPATSA
jgi:hypothetical protein